MAFPALWTYQDAVDLGVDYRNAASDERNQRRVISAVQATYRAIAQARNWKYLYAPYRIQLVAPYSTGTITYDHTGGASERLVTLATGSWPTWAAYGTLRVASINHKVASRTSTSVINLDAVNNPGADIAAGTSYSLYRSEYPLPSDFKALCLPETESSFYGMTYLKPDEWNKLDRQSSSSGTPSFFTILGSGDLYAQKQIALYPYPSAAGTLDFIYQRDARKLVYSGYETNSKVGTVSCSASTTVTGSSTQFAAAMVGSIIRFSSSTTLPDGEGGLNRYQEQRVITAVGSTTGLTLDSATTGTYSGVAYTISDPIDLHPTMLDAFRWGFLKELDALNKNGEGYQFSNARYREALMLAFENDSDVIFDRHAMPGWQPGPLGYTVDVEVA